MQAFHFVAAVLMYCRNSRSNLLPWSSSKDTNEGWDSVSLVENSNFSVVFSICTSSSAVMLLLSEKQQKVLGKWWPALKLQFGHIGHLLRSPSSKSGKIVFVSNRICSSIKPKHQNLFHLFCSKYCSTDQRHPIGICETQDCEVAILCGTAYLRLLTSCRQSFLTTNIPILCFEIYMILPHPQTGFVWSYQVEICF